MAEIVGVVFRGGAKVYHFDSAGLELNRGDRVVVQTINGPEIGQVVEPPCVVDDSELPAPLKKVIRVATGKDLQSQAAGEQLRGQAMETCRELIAQHGLDMRLVAADVGFGAEKITFSFYADERVDFRELVTDLAKALKMRVQLRQIGSREEARMMGGLGPCGRSLCCTLFAGDDEPVSIRMAKEQNLPLNPMKISGLCGRLMCCLKYEQQQYVSFRKEAPAKGTPVSSPAGEGVVAGYSLTKDAIAVKLEDGSLISVELSTCRSDETGGLVVVPEAEESSYVPVLEDMSEPGDLAVAESAAEDLPVVEAEVVLGANGEPVEVIVAEAPRRGRRRGKSRRKSKGTSQSRPAAEGEARNSSKGPSGESAAGSGAKRKRRSAERGKQQAPATGRGQEGPGAGERPAAGEGGAKAAGSRRSGRRRTRREGGAGVNGGAGSGVANGQEDNSSVGTKRPLAAREGREAPRVREGREGASGSGGDGSSRAGA